MIDIDKLKENCIQLRRQWRALLDAKNTRRQQLAGEGRSVLQIRHDREYRRLKHEKNILGTKIRHREKKIQRAVASAGKGNPDE